MFVKYLQISMKIRRFLQKDTGKVVNLYNRLREYELKLHKGLKRRISENWEKKKTNLYVKKSVASKNNILLVADNGELAGFIIGYTDKGEKEKQGKFDIFVKKEYRGHGVSKLLLNSLLKWFKKKKCKYVYLYTYASNKIAKKFYRKMGFDIMGETYVKDI
jgi:ribosomal protein S18 acetylase RimI-like enzyme